MADEGLEWVVLGSGGHAVCVVDALRHAGDWVSKVIDPYETQDHVLGVPVAAALPVRFTDVPLRVAVAIGDNFRRQEAAENFKEAFPLATFPMVKHPTAVVSENAEIGEGTVLLQGAVVGPGSRIGSFVIVNTLASTNHDCSLGNFSSLGPHAGLAGGSSVGRLSHVGIGSMLRERTTIGEGSIIGAHSFVAHDIGSNTVAYGTPARPIRRRVAGEPLFG